MSSTSIIVSQMDGITVTTEPNKHYCNISHADMQAGGKKIVWSKGVVDKIIHWCAKNNVSGHGLPDTAEETHALMLFIDFFTYDTEAFANAATKVLTYIKAHVINTKSEMIGVLREDKIDESERLSGHEVAWKLWLASASQVMSIKQGKILDFTVPAHLVHQDVWAPAKQRKHITLRSAVEAAVALLKIKAAAVDKNGGTVAKSVSLPQVSSTAVPAMIANLAPPTPASGIHLDPAPVAPATQTASTSDSKLQQSETPLAPASTIKDVSPFHNTICEAMLALNPDFSRASMSSWLNSTEGSHAVLHSLQSVSDMTAEIEKLRQDKAEQHRQIEILRGGGTAQADRILSQAEAIAREDREIEVVKSASTAAHEREKATLRHDYERQLAEKDGQIRRSDDDARKQANEMVKQAISEAEGSHQHDLKALRKHIEQQSIDREVQIRRLHNDLAQVHEQLKRVSAEKNDNATRVDELWLSNAAKNELLACRDHELSMLRNAAVQKDLEIEQLRARLEKATDPYDDAKTFLQASNDPVAELPQKKVHWSSAAPITRYFDAHTTPPLSPPPSLSGGHSAPPSPTYSIKVPSPSCSTKPPSPSYFPSDNSATVNTELKDYSIPRFFYGSDNNRISGLDMGSFSSSAVKTETQQLKKPNFSFPVTNPAVAAAAVDPHPTHQSHATDMMSHQEMEHQKRAIMQRFAAVV